MKVAGFLGSPRRDGNSSVLAREILRGASEAGASAAHFYLNELDFRGCQGCNACKVGGSCVESDDMTQLYDEVVRADVLVLASPVYLWHVSGQMKLFLDRLYAFGRHDGTCSLPRRKRGIFVYSQADGDSERFRGMFESVAGILSFGIAIENTLVVTNGTEPGVVASDSDMMRRAWRLGKDLVCGRANVETGAPC